MRREYTKEDCDQIVARVIGFMPDDMVIEQLLAIYIRLSRAFVASFVKAMPPPMLGEDRGLYAAANAFVRAVDAAKASPEDN